MSHCTHCWWSGVYPHGLHLERKRFLESSSLVTVHRHTYWFGSLKCWWRPLTTGHSLAIVGSGGVKSQECGCGNRVSLSGRQAVLALWAVRMWTCARKFDLQALNSALCLLGSDSVKSWHSNIHKRRCAQRLAFCGGGGHDSFKIQVTKYTAVEVDSSLRLSSRYFLTFWLDSAKNTSLSNWQAWWSYQEI